MPVARVAERLLKLGGCAPDCGLALFLEHPLGPLPVALRVVSQDSERLRAGTNWLIMLLA